MMEDLGTENVLMDEHMGHIDGSVSARYAHVTPGMRKRLMLGLTEQWEAALDARLAMSATSPVRSVHRENCTSGGLVCVGVGTLGQVRGDSPATRSSVISGRLPCS
jgi:hypothetical protein